MSRENEICVFEKTGNAPEETTAPNGSYTYVRHDNAIALDLIAATEGHTPLSHRSLVRTWGITFNHERDDAGVLTVNWNKTPEEIEELVTKTVQVFAKSGRVVDPDAYRNQLLSNYGVTRVTREPGRGSDTLSYVPNTVAVERTLQLLRDLFTDAEIS